MRRSIVMCDDFESYAKSLDDKTLGRLRAESYMILKSLLKSGNQQYASHPSAKKWVGKEGRLSMFSADVCAEWKSRGYPDRLLHEIFDLADKCKPNSF